MTQRRYQMLQHKVHELDLLMRKCPIKPVAAAEIYIGLDAIMDQLQNLKEGTIGYNKAGDPFKYTI